ncbi:molybdenum cofactor biosynthesis protein MoaE [Cumulibacter manganitolerans]|uniref:molybdenum cofactor biosynthesis protein MoaE n=1 Tax=Cumulibacter manganitolerans TaxID=1884992 RepID=UPI001E4C6348|nr:molybdenum cofactor biosynthesis protein MoaE [Cumulibacter manganitolerans]
MVLAAGAGTRMGMPKALVRLPGGKSLLTHSLQVLREGGCEDIVVVLGAGEPFVRKALEVWQDRIEKIMGDGRLHIVSNPDYAEGMSTSVRAGLAAAQELGPQTDAVVIQLVDTPEISPDAIDRLRKVGGPSALAVATYGGIIGHPMLIGREHWAPIATSISGDVGARQYLNGRDDLQKIACDGLGSPADIDTPEQLRTFTHRDLVRTDIRKAEVTQSEISVSFLELLVRDRRAGAVVTFSGTVRDHDHGRQVERLNYMAHPSADEVIRTITAEVAAMSGVRGIAVQHRVGELAIGDIAIGCAVAADHRQEAFETCSMLVERVKAELPVWKHQIFEDGTDEWVNAP